MNDISYVLMSAARNEEAHIAATIASVLAQTRQPQRWVIVSDGSSDRTDRIVLRFASEHPWIELVRVEGGRDRQFASKVFALRAAISRLLRGRFDFIGNLDVDITLPPDYYEKLLARFADRPRLGIAGGLIVDVGPHQWLDRSHNLEAVPGAVQLFRTPCFIDIGCDYPALELGGEDAVVEVLARMHGWRVQAFPELVGYHHRVTGTAGRGVLTARLIAGRRDHCLGYHPLFFSLKALHRSIEKPYLIGAGLMLYGYWRARLTGDENQVPDQVRDYLRHEQLGRMRTGLVRLFKRLARGLR